MVKVNIYGPQGQIVESTDLSETPTYNDPTCTHPRVIEVDDPLAKALQCQICGIGWLIKAKD